MSWLNAHWKAVTAIVAALGTLAVVAAAGAEVQTRLSELEETSEVAKENTKTVAVLVDMHEQAAIRDEYEARLMDLMDVIADLEAEYETVAEEE